MKQAVLIFICFSYASMWPVASGHACEVPGRKTPQASSGRSLFVSPQGKGNACSKDAPCREVLEASRQARPGDTIRIADGSYDGFTLLALSGTAERPITFQIEGKNVQFLVTTHREDNRDTIFVTRCSHLIFDGFNVENALRAGLRIDWSNFITVRNSTFRNSGTWGIFADHSDDLLLEGNECTGSKKEHGIYVSDGSRRPTVRYNHLHHNAFCGLHMNGDASNSTTGLIEEARVEGNLIHDNGEKGGAGINMDGVMNSVVANNILYNNHATGIVGFKQNGARGPSGLKVLNNTVVQANDGRAAMQIVAASGKNLVRNNIFVHPNLKKPGFNFGTTADKENTDSDYNLVDRIAIDGANVDLDSWKKHNSTEQHSRKLPALNTLFQDLTNMNFRLHKSSDAKAGGVHTPDVEIDFSKNCRKKPPSIGAYE